MKTPTGAQILEILIRLYEKQEGVKIKYHIETKENKHETTEKDFASNL